MPGKAVKQKLVDPLCSFKTFPNGLRQQPISAAIILSALTLALLGKLPDSLISSIENLAD